MSKLPLKALRDIQEYCEKTKCKDCVFILYTDKEALCKLDNVPCFWKIADLRGKE